MTFLLLSAQILLAIDSPTNQVDSYRIYLGLSPNSYFDYQTFPNTNRFTLVVTNTGRIYLAASALNAAGESDLSNEIVAQIFTGYVQLSTSPSGPWTNAVAIFVPVEVKEPAWFVRVRLETQ